MAAIPAACTELGQRLALESLGGRIGEEGSCQILFMKELKSKIMEFLLHLNIKNMICILSGLTISLFLSSCNFNITDIPGPQISSTIETSKKHGTFICAYNLKGNKINGIRVESFFAEKKYWLGEGLFGEVWY